MASRFHRWWLGSCIVALLLASWAGGFSVAVTAVFVVIYLTGMTLVGPEDEADIGLARDEPTGGPVVTPEPEPEPLDHVEDAEPYPDDEDAEPAPETPAIVVESAEESDTAAVVETAETDGVETESLIKEADEPGNSPA